MGSGLSSADVLVSVFYSDAIDSGAMVDILLWPVAIVGHLGFWCVVFNRVHATSLPRVFRKQTEKVVAAAVLMIAAAYLFCMVAVGSVNFFFVAEQSRIGSAYLYACLISGIFFMMQWAYRKWRFRRPNEVVDYFQEIIDVGAIVGEPLYGGAVGKVLGAIPGNQADRLAKDSMRLKFDRLPAELEGLRVCQLSDFHLTGQIDRRYFQQVVRIANEFEPDLILVTGDLFDKSDCLPWIDDVFAALSAKHGVYYVLGNHDRRIKDQSKLAGLLSDAGLVAVGGKWVSVTIGGKQIAIAGNELPWFEGADKLPKFEETRFYTQDGSSPFKILLSHSPDQLFWADGYDFDWMLAGHTHGGQIQIPMVGPIVAPSRHGVLYASGTFKLKNMLMHVSRGLSGDKCIRINCPPEIGLFTLTGNSV